MFKSRPHWLAAEPKFPSGGKLWRVGAILQLSNTSIYGRPWILITGQYQIDDRMLLGRFRPQKGGDHRLLEPALNDMPIIKVISLQVWKSNKDEKLTTLLIYLRGGMVIIWCTPNAGSTRLFHFIQFRGTSSRQNLPALVSISP